MSNSFFPDGAIEYALPEDRIVTMKEADLAALRRRAEQAAQERDALLRKYEVAEVEKRILSRLIDEARELVLHIITNSDELPIRVACELALRRWDAERTAAAPQEE